MKRAKDVKRRTAEIRQEYQAAPDPIKANGFRPYVPPPLPLDVQRRIDDYRAIRSLYP